MLYMCACTNVCLSVYVCTCDDTCSYIDMEMAEEDTKCSPRSLSTYCSEVGFSLILGLAFSWLVRNTASHSDQTCVSPFQQLAVGSCRTLGLS